MNARVVAVFALILSSTLAIPDSNGQTKDEHAAQVLQTEVDRLKTRIDTDRSTLGDIELGILEAEHKILILQRQLAVLRAQFVDVGVEIDVLAAKYATQSAQLPEIHRQIENVLRVQYQLKNQSRLKLTLATNDPTTLQRLLTYYDYLLRAEGRRLHQLNSLLETTDASREQLQARRVTIENIQQALGEKGAALEQNRAQRGEQILALRAVLKQNKRLLNDKLIERKKLAQLVRGLGTVNKPVIPATQVSRLASLRLKKGKLALPVGGDIRTRFNQPDELSGVLSKGITIAGSHGGDVRSISAGRVVYSDWFRGFGLLLVLDHGDGFMSLYGYNSELLYPVGTMVDTNATIARIGDTSGRAQAELYFEVRKDGVALDPLLWCRR
jgi:murein hydrolase activator